MSRRTRSSSAIPRGRSGGSAPAAASAWNMARAGTKSFTARVADRPRHGQRRAPLPQRVERGARMTITPTKTQEIPLVDLRAQYATIRDDVRKAIDEVLESMQLTIGPNVKAFDQEYAAFCGTKHAIGVGSGTDALQLAIRALGIAAGDEVITVSHTFFATVEAILYSGARPILVDVDPKTFNMDFAAAAQAITPRTKAIMPVHLYGRTVDMKPLLALGKEKGLQIIEDACQAHGATLDT